MTPEEFHRFLQQPLSIVEVSGLLSTVIDFMEYSENNLDWQRREAVRRAKIEAEDLQIKNHDPRMLSDFRSQIIQGAENRFDFGLSQTARYAGLVAFVTTIDRCTRLFAKRLAVPLPKDRRREIGPAEVLDHLNIKTGHTFASEIALFRNVTTIRNCLVHSAGTEGDKHEKEDSESGSSS